MKQIKKNGLLWGIVGTIALLVIVAVVVRTPKTCHHVEVIAAIKIAFYLVLSIFVQNE